MFIHPDEDLVEGLGKAIRAVIYMSGAIAMNFDGDHGRAPVLCAGAEPDLPHRPVRVLFHLRVAFRLWPMLALIFCLFLIFLTFNVRRDPFL